jgi:mannose-6-phosphate isomerase-like protein (cupin superfamily)
MNSDMLNPKVVQAGEARVYDHLGGEKLALLLSAEETGGAFSLLLDESPPGGGPPLHIHRREDEIFYILEGAYEVQVNDDRFTAAAGATVFMPKGVPHTFANFGAQPAKAIVILSPAGLEQFFAEVEPLATQTEPDMNAMLTLIGKYGVEPVGPPLAPKQ